MLDLRQLVYSAAMLLPNSFNKQELIMTKGSMRDEVTEYDFRIQEFIIDSIKNEYPDAQILGEEGEKNTKIDNSLLFVIDPIDGTANFINDCKFSCISIAKLNYGEVLEAVVYNPYLHELFYAKKNCGAWLNDTRLKVHDTVLGKSIVGYCNCPYDEEITDLTFDFGKSLYKKCLDFRRMGASALEICYSACGRYQLYCERILYPWDYVAASLIVEEAGGVVTDWEGNKLRIEKRCSVLTGCPTAHKDFIKVYKEFVKNIDNIKVSTTI